MSNAIIIRVKPGSSLANGLRELHAERKRLGITTESLREDLLSELCNLLIRWGDEITDASEQHAVDQGDEK